MQVDHSQWASTYCHLQQRLAEFFHEIDIGLGRDIGDYYVEDGALLVAGNATVGREAIARFYSERARRIAVEQKDGTRTARHLTANVRIAQPAPAEAAVEFVLLYFSGEGKPPLFDATTPTVVADCQMDFRCEPDGVWRIVKFDSQPVFVGNDPFMQKAIIRG